VASCLPSTRAQISFRSSARLAGGSTGDSAYVTSLSSRRRGCIASGCDDCSRIDMASVERQTHSATGEEREKEKERGPERKATAQPKQWLEGRRCFGSEWKAEGVGLGGRGRSISIWSNDDVDHVRSIDDAEGERSGACTAPCEGLRGAGAAGAAQDPHLRGIVAEDLLLGGDHRLDALHHHVERRLHA
jgi:hypothetical protein